MATVPVTPVPTTPAGADVTREIRIYAHSTLLYWWPVWAAGLVMGIMTLVEGGRMAIVPARTQVAVAEDGTAQQTNGEQGFIALKGRKVLILPAEKAPAEVGQPTIRMARNKNLGVLFVIVLLLIVLITNVPMRGLWSLVLIMMVFMLSLIFALWEVWDWIFEHWQHLQIYINAGGYFFIAGVLFAIWAFTVFVFDRRTFVAFTSGQVRVAMAVGAGDTVYSTEGMTFQKKQDDLFRHWIVGLGSGDLIIHRSNTNQEIDMPNVLFVGSKIKMIERLIKEKEVV